MSQSFVVNNAPLFDSVRHTQGGVPHLLQLLWDEYVASLVEALNARQEAGLIESHTPAEVISMAPATAFLKFAAAYLHKYRVVENFFVDANHGVRLSNNKLVVVCPGINIQGTMQESGAVPVTHGRSQSGHEGVVDIMGASREI